MVADIANDTIEVVVNGETFTFRVPSPRDLARVGSRAANLRMRDGILSSDSLDQLTNALYDAMAHFEILLLKADAKNNWPFSKNDKNEVVIDSSKFPASSTTNLLDAYRGFQSKLDTFLSTGSGQPGGKEIPPGMPET